MLSTFPASARGPMRRIALLLALTVATIAPAQSAKRPITDKDLFAFNWIGDTQLSPSGNTLCFVQASVTPDHTGYQTSLYLLDLTTPNATPSAVRPRATFDTSPRWSPDGKQIAFTCCRHESPRASTPAQLVPWSAFRPQPAPSSSPTCPKAHRRRNGRPAAQSSPFSPPPRKIKPKQS